MFRYHWGLIRQMPARLFVGISLWSTLGIVVVFATAYFNGPLGQRIVATWNGFPNYWANIGLAIWLIFWWMRISYEENQTLTQQLQDTRRALAGKKNREQISDDLARFQSQGVNLKSTISAGTFSIDVLTSNLETWRRELHDYALGNLSRSIAVYLLANDVTFRDISILTGGGRFLSIEETRLSQRLNASLERLGEIMKQY